MPDRPHLIVVPAAGEPARNLADRIYPFRAVRPHELVWSDGRLLHAVVPDQRPDAQVTGCGHEIPNPDLIGPAFRFPGPALCPAFECFGEA